MGIEATIMEFRDMETDKTDLELILEFQSGSSPAVDALYERYRRPLYGYVNRQMQGHTSQADDVFQQTWMRAIDNLSTYRDQEKFSAWLMRIAHNLIIDYYRSLKRRAEDELDETYGDTTEDTSGERGCIPGSPGESGLVSRGSQGLRSPLESRRGSLGAP